MCSTFRVRFSCSVELGLFLDIFHRRVFCQTPPRKHYRCLFLWNFVLLISHALVAETVRYRADTKKREELARQPDMLHSVGVQLSLIWISNYCILLGLQTHTLYMKAVARAHCQTFVTVLQMLVANCLQSA